MTKQITLEELLELVNVKQDALGNWYIVDVKGHVSGNVYGNVGGNILGDVCGNVEGDVRGYVSGNINGREWEYVETPIERLKRLIREGSDQKELLWAVNQLENN